MPKDVPPSFATPLKSPRKASSSSQIPLFVSITIARLLHYLRNHTPHTSYIRGNLTSRAHQSDPKRRLPPSNVSRMAQNIVLNRECDAQATRCTSACRARLTYGNKCRQDLAQTYLDAPLACAQKGPTLVAPPVPDLCHDPTYCILDEIVGRWGRHGRLILVRPVHVFGGNSRDTREATVSSNSSPIAAAAAVPKPC